MYAIVNYKGKQFRVEEGQEIRVPKTSGSAGNVVTIDGVLFINDEQGSITGIPTVSGATVEATILDHGQEPKITVFKFKRRKGFRRKNGHRQSFTTLRINSIRKPDKSASKAVKPKAKPKKSTPSKASLKKQAEKATSDPAKRATAESSPKAPVKKAARSTSATKSKTTSKTKKST